MFFIAIFMSLLFGFISESVISTSGIILASCIIFLFIFIAVIFDMIGIAAASADIEIFEIWERKGVRGAKKGIMLCNNSQKVCSFCADVVGDICSTLCGAGGVAIASLLTKNLQQNKYIMFISIFTSALIAGLTIFFKAIMKEKALKDSNKILLKLGKFLTIFDKK